MFNFEQVITGLNEGTIRKSHKFVPPKVIHVALGKEHENAHVLEISPEYATKLINAYHTHVANNTNKPEEEVARDVYSKLRRAIFDELSVDSKSHTTSVLKSALVWENALNSYREKHKVPVADEGAGYYRAFNRVKHLKTKNEVETHINEMLDVVSAQPELVGLFAAIGNIHGKATPEHAVYSALCTFATRLQGSHSGDTERRKELWRTALGAFKEKHGFKSNTHDLI